MNAAVRNRFTRRFSGPKDKAASLLRRIEVQGSFASAFADIQADPRKTEWKGLISQALQTFEALPSAASLDELEAAVAKAEAIMAPIGAEAKTCTIHCVGHGHIDMNWMWSWPETVAATHDTFASVLSLMKQVPGVTYSQSQASVYALIEKYHPEMFAEIQQRVKEGVWEVAAAHWVEGDKNLAHGESIARHLLYTRQYFKEKFGLEPEDVPIDWEPDTFGHANTLPGILAKGGVKFYYCCRPGGGHDHGRIGDERPRLFWWQGPDGSRVLVNRESTWYNSYVNIGDNIAEALVPFAKETGLRDWLNVYGWGNHGGGPTLTEVRYLQETATWPIYPKVIFSTVKGYFETILPQLPETLAVLDHELNFEFTGCYTSQSAIKRANRFGEAYCLDAETLALVANSLTGREVPKDQLREAWINVLFNQFHDILPGSGVVHTRNHATAIFQETAAITGAIKKEGAKALGAHLNTASLLPDTPEGREEKARLAAGLTNRPYEAGAGIGAMYAGYSIGVNAHGAFRPILVWNPTDFERTELVTVPLYDLTCDHSSLVARDENGVSHPTIFMGKGSDWGHSKITVAFVAKVPAFGYRTYLLGEGVADTVDSVVTPLQNRSFVTPSLEIAFDPGTSGIKRLKDVRTGMEILGGLAQVHLTKERPTGMSAWVLGAEPEDPEPLLAESCHVHRVWHNEGTGAPIDGGSAYVVEQKLQVPGGRSSATLRSIVHGLDARIDFELEVDWREIGTPATGIPGLEVAFSGMPGQVTTYETPFGTVDRTLLDDEEVPTLRFAHAFEGYGMTVLQDSKYGHSRKGDVLAFRVVRSSYDPDPTPEVGQQTVRFSVIFHDKKPNRSELVRLGTAWNHPLLIVPAPLQEGTQSCCQSFAQVEGEGVVMTALKAAEDGGILLRVAEFEGKEAAAKIALNSVLAKGITKAESVDLLERPDGGPMTFENRVVEVTIPPFGIRSVRLS